MKMKAVITGGTSGIGYGVGQQLARHNWDVAIVGRNQQKGEQIADELNGRFLQADLSLISANITLAQKITEPIDALILCAGALFDDNAPLTAEGLEPTFALNYLSRFALSQQLINRMVLNGRIIMVSGNGRHKNSSTNWQEHQSGFDAAFKAALAVDLYAAEFARRHQDIQIHTCYPGWVKTNLLQNVALHMRLMTNLFASSIEKGSSYLVRLATEDHKVIHWNKDKLMTFSPPLPKQEVASNLWDYSQRLVAEITAVSSSHTTKSIT